MTHGDRAIEWNQCAVRMHHLEICKLGNELRYGIVELPLALFVQKEHGYSDNWLCHGGDAEDRVFTQRLTAPERLKTVLRRFHELAMACNQHADSGVVARGDLRLHRAVEAAEAFGREAD